MNILITTYQGGMAGSTQSIFYLAKGLASKGHQVYLGCRKGTWLEELATQDPNIVIVTMQMKKKFSLESIKEHRDVIKKYKIDIVNAQSSKDRYLPIFSKWLFGGDYKIVHTRRQKPASVGGFLQNFIYNNGADKIIAVSRGVQQQLIALGIREAKVEVIHNGLDVAKFKSIQPEIQKELKIQHQIKKEDVVLGCISRLKDQYQIIRALHHVKIPCTLILVGVKEGEIDENTAFEVPHRIIYTGTISNREALNYYGLFDVKLLASSMEGLSQSLLEAMALGVPVIATNASGNPDLIKQGQNGLLFEDNNTKGLAQAIEQVITDEALRLKLIENGKKTALEDFSISNTINNFEALFKQLAGIK